MSGKSVFNLSENIAAAIAYVGLFFTGIILLVLERDNKFVRFHALQSTVFFGALSVLSFLSNFVPFIGGAINGILGILSFVAYVYLIYMAFKGRTFKIPVIGDVAWEQVNK